MMNIVRFYYEKKELPQLFIGYFRNDAHSAWGKL